MSDETTPRYELLQQAHMPRAPGRDAELLPVGTEVLSDADPGEHMKPLNAAAHARYAITPPKQLDAGHLEKPKFSDGSVEEVSARLGEAIGKAMAAALLQAGVVQAPADDAKQSRTSKSAAPPPPPPPPPSN